MVGGTSESKIHYAEGAKTFFEKGIFKKSGTKKSGGSRNFFRLLLSPVQMSKKVDALKNAQRPQKQIPPKGEYFGIFRYSEKRLDRKGRKKFSSNQPSVMDG